MKRQLKLTARDLFMSIHTVRAILYALRPNN